MMRRYGKQVPSTNSALGNDEEAPRVIIVCNDFNIEQFLAHATCAEVHQEDENKEDDDDDHQGTQTCAINRIL